MNTSFGTDSNVITDSRGRSVYLSDDELRELRYTLASAPEHHHGPACPRDDDDDPVYSLVDCPGPSAEPGGCEGCGFVHDLDEPHLMAAPVEVQP